MRQLLTYRPYTGEPDYQRIRAFLQSIYALRGPCPLITIGDLDYWRFQHPDPEGCIQLCGLWQENNDTVRGFAWPGLELDGTGIIDLSVHPRYTEFLQPMLQWSEAWLQQAMPFFGKNRKQEGGEDPDSQRGQRNLRAAIKSYDNGKIG